MRVGKQIWTCTIFLALVYLLCLSGLLLADDTIPETIHSLTIEQKVGQLLMLGFHGTSLSKEDMAFLKKIQPGGIVFYARNFTSASDLPPVLSRIKGALKDQNIPLFFAIDQEGGIVHRIRGENYNPPSAPAIGAANSEFLAKAVGRSAGNALRELGLTINLAPVLDVPADIDSSPLKGRCFSDDPELIARLGTAYIKGMKASGMLATAKHFPGIGRAREDSHQVLPRIIWKSQQERENDLLPFLHAKNSGVDAIMVGHVIAEPGDSGNPASLSSYWMKNVLRDTIGFQGLVLVDNIEMEPIKDLMDIGRGAVASFLAGADIILVSHEKKNQLAVYHALLDAVRKGEVTHERLNESLARILRVKTGLGETTITDGNLQGLETVSRRVAEHAVLALKSKGAPQPAIGDDEKILYTGFNPRMFDAIRGAYKNTDILNTTVLNFRQMNPGTPLERLLQKYGWIIIDSDYPDASEVAALCRTIPFHCILVASNLWNVGRKLQAFAPKYLYISPENRNVYFSVITDILRGALKAKGYMPFSLVLPPEYEYMSMDRAED